MEGADLSRRSDRYANGLGLLAKRETWLTLLLLRSGRGVFQQLGDTNVLTLDCLTKSIFPELPLPSLFSRLLWQAPIACYLRALFCALSLLVVAGEAQRGQRLADADRAPAVEEVGGGGVRHALALRDGAGRLRQRALRVVLTASHNPPSAAQKTVARGKMGRGGTYGDECLDLLDGEVRGLGQQDGNVARDVRARHRRAGRRRVPARPRTRRE